MPIVFGMPGNEQLADELAVLTASETGRIEFRRFPDGESYVRIHGDVADRAAFLVCTLARPDEQFLSLVFAARAIRLASAKRMTLIAPYLAYMRQDLAFHPGEAISSRIFADLISSEFDALVTVEPHLHRIATLAKVYGIPAAVVHTSELIGAWVRDHAESPVVLGPDAESAQWVEVIARNAGCPWAVFGKQRRGDRDVELIVPNLEPYRQCTPVLVDDIVSSGATMIAAAKMLLAAGMRPPHCIAVHALFDEAVGAELRGLSQSFLTTDTVVNRFSKFRIAPLIAEQLSTAEA